MLLRQQLTEATDGEMIRNYAVNKLGMVKPSSKQVFEISITQKIQVNNPSSTQEDAKKDRIDWLGVALGTAEVAAPAEGECGLLSPGMTVRKRLIWLLVGFCLLFLRCAAGSFSFRSCGRRN